MHGFAQDECLICRTLGTGPSQAGSAPTSTSHGRAPKRGRAKVAASDDMDRLLAGSPAAGLPATRGTTGATTRQDRSLAQPAGRDGEGRTRSGHFFLSMVGVVVVAGVVLLAFGGIVDLAFHIFEYAALALVSGWVGFKIGHWRARRGH